MSGAGDAPRLDAERIVEVFNRHQVRYVTIGAFAAQQQGALLPPTHDIDFTPAAGRANLRRLSAALDDLGARVRTADVPGAWRSITTPSPWPAPAYGIWCAPTGSSTCRSGRAAPTATTT